MIQLYAIFIANMLGILLMVVLFIGTKWRMFANRGVNIYLKLMMLNILISCIVDPLVFLADSRPGELCRFIIVLGNTWLFMANIISAFLWFAFLMKHLNHQISNVHLLGIYVVCVFGALMLIINLFYPVVFFVDADNTYVRCNGYFYFVAVNAGLLIDSLFSYLHIRKRSGLLKSFPIWIYIIPIIIGVFLQTVFYGISVIWPCAAISIVGVILSVQGESSFIDRLTGTYNRTFLETIKLTTLKSATYKYAFLMIDLNRFKTINDTFGHLAGDEALRDAAAVITEVVDDKGTICRFGGDEFIVVLNNNASTNIDFLAKQIHDAFTLFNATHKKAYELSVSVGYVESVDSIETFDEVISAVDKDMYASKKIYYENTSVRR